MERRACSAGGENIEGVARADGAEIAVGMVRVVQDLLVEVAPTHAVLAREAQLALECGGAARGRRAAHALEGCAWAVVEGIPKQ